MAKSNKNRPENTTGRHVLVHDGDFALAAGPGATASDDAPRSRFVKDIISVGDYTHPIDGWRLNVTTERLDQWVAAFRRMRDKGVDVEFVVDHRYDAEAIRGYAIDFERRGDTLFAVGDLDQRGAELAKSVKNVSVLIEKEVVDGTGNNYGEAITHVAFVQQPIVPGQSAFVPIAASVGSDHQDIPILMLGTESSDSEGNQAMTPEQIAELRKLYGLGDDVADDDLFEAIKVKVGESTEANKGLNGQVAKLSGTIESLNAKVAEGSKPKIDLDVLDQSAELLGDRIDGLVDKGKVTPAVAASLKAELIGEAGARNEFSLSRKVSGGDRAFGRRILDIVESNDIVSLKETTSSQALGRNVPGESETFDPAETVKEMVESAGGAVEKSK